MSGPKTTSYVVSENELQMQRAIAETWASIRNMETRIHALEIDIQAAKTKYAGEPIDVEILAPLAPPSGSPLAALENHLMRLRAVGLQTLSRLQAVIGQIETRRMLLAVGATGTGTIETAEQALSRAAAERAKRSTDATAQRTTAEKAQRIRSVSVCLGRLHSDVGSAERAALEDLSRKIIQEESAQRSDVLQKELRLRVQRVNDQAKATELETDEATVMIGRLRGLDSPEVRAVVTELERVERRELRMTASLRARVAPAYRAAKAAADRQYAAGVMAQVLTDLGYEVDGGMSTLFVEGGLLHIQKPAWADYWVRLRVDSARDEINFNVVCAASDNARPTREAEVRDREMEEEWCSQFQQVLDALHHRGVDSKVLRRERAGAFPVQVVRDGTLITKRRQARVATPKRKRNAPR